VLVVALPLVALFVAPVRVEDPLPAGLRALGALVLLGGTVALLVRQTRLTVADRDRRVDGLLAAVGLAVAVFAFSFYALDVHRPDEVEGLRTRLDALYFTGSTMLTVGYGDVHAAGQTARALVVVQMAFDVVFLATAGAVLTTRARDSAARRHAGGPG